MRTITLRLELQFDCLDSDDALQRAKEFVDAINDGLLPNDFGEYAPVLMSLGKHGAGVEAMEQDDIVKDVEFDMDHN